VGAHGPRMTACRPPPSVAQFGEPVAHLEHAGVIWPNVGLHLSPSPQPGVSATSPFTCQPGSAPAARTHRSAAVRFGCAGFRWCPPRLAAIVPGSCHAARARCLPRTGTWLTLYTCLPQRLPSPDRVAPLLSILSFTVPSRHHSKINFR
jgi:hypothetical protein